MKIMQIALAATVALASGAAIAQPGPPPPPPSGYVPPPAPGPIASYGLEQGHYVWRPRGWVWVPARWVFRTPGAVRWVPGHLNRAGIWVEGHWR